MKVFITGLTGTLGTALARLHAGRGDEVVGCARSEARAAEWLRSSDTAGELVVGDAFGLGERYGPVIYAALGCERIYHCAAMKHVDLCEANPAEAQQQNVDLTAAVLEGGRRLGVPVVFVSSDKACLPQSVYGATKLIGERLAVRAGAAVVRLGNLIGSSGSVFKLWAEARAAGRPIRLTDPEMTRYFIPVEEAARFLESHAVPGKVTAPYMAAVRMGDVTAAIGGAVEVVGRRPGETQHQWIATREEDVQFFPPPPAHLAGLGFCSATAPRWKPSHLLEVAGVKV